jgi:hypothetical protein
MNIYFNATSLLHRNYPKYTRYASLHSNHFLRHRNLYKLEKRVCLCFIAKNKIFNHNLFTAYNSPIKSNAAGTVVTGAKQVLFLHT